MQQTEANPSALATTKRIAQLESEIAARRDEIRQLRQGGDIRDDADESKHESFYDKPAGKSESMDNALDLEELIVLWEQRLAKKGRGVNLPSKHLQPRKSALPTIPAIVYTPSTDSDEVRDAPPTMLTPSSPRRHSTQQLPKSFDSPTSVLDHGMGQAPYAVARPHILERLIEERDDKIKCLESVITSDTDIIEKMKDTIEKMVADRKKSKSRSSLQLIVGELESTIASQEKQNKTLKAKCLRLHEFITELEGHSSSHENLVEFMRAEMVKLLFASRTTIEAMKAEVVHRDEAIAALEASFQENASKSQRIVTELGVRNSTLEDQIEELRAENVRVRIGSRMMEEETKLAEEAMNTEMQLFYIEHSRHEIL